MDATQFKAIYDRLFTLELQLSLLEMIELEKSGDLMDLEDLAAKYGITLSHKPQEKPEGYDQMIPEQYKVKC